ncbi:tandem-95 repeat protein [Mycolicibacterium vaccae]|nr:tandem-95 repeat protein [Mycolicibacterium vaccae]
MAAPQHVQTTPVTLATAVVTALLSPDLAPGPAAPARPPLLIFAVLDWLRREIQRTFFNRPPDAVTDSYSTSEGLDVTGNVLTNDTDADGEALRASLVRGPTHGDLTLNADGTFTYTPGQNFSGTDTFTYKASDAGFHLHGLLPLVRPDWGHTDTVRVTLTVTPVNDMPVTMGDNYTVTAGQVLTVAGPGVLANDNDPDGDRLTAVKFSDPTHGVLALKSDGSFTYTPDDDFTGTDRFEYFATDGITDGVPAFVHVTVTEEAVPVAGYDSFATPTGTAITIDADALLANDFDNENDPMTVVVTSAPENGELVDNGDGTYTYTPDDGFVGTDYFEYVAADAGGQSEPAEVSVNVGVPANTAPVAVADHLTTRVDTPRVITPVDLLGNDTDADGDELSAYVVSDPLHGTLDFDDAGVFIYTPDPGFEGYDSFHYTAFDGSADSTPIEVLMLVAGQSTGNTPPVAGYDSVGAPTPTPR